MEDISNVEKLENSLNKFIQTETHLNDPVLFLSVKKTDRAREVTSKRTSKREVKIYFEGQEKQDLKVPILEEVQNKIYKISFSHSVRFGTRFHLEMADESRNVQLSTDDTVEKNQNLAALSSSDSITEDPNNTKAWTETEILRQKGWAVEEVHRNGYANAKIYYHLMSGHRFRSMKQAMEFVSKGTLRSRNKSKATVHEKKSKSGKSGILTEPDGIGNTDKEGYGNASVSINPKTSMEVGNPKEPEQAVYEEKERQDDGVTSENQTETTEETANDDDKKETNDVKATVTEEHKDSETVVDEKAKTEETEELAKDVEKGESNEPLPNEKSVVSSENEELTQAPRNENDTEKNSKKHPLIVDEAVTEPEAKKTKLEETKPEGEQVIIDVAESSAWEPPFPPEFYAETETYDCDSGPLWQFHDPYFIELAQEGNPPKDVAYVSLKSDKNKDV